MRVGILCTMLNEFGRKGRYNSQEIGLAKALAKKGHSVEVFKCIAKGQGAEDGAIGNGIAVHYIPAHGIGAHGYLNTKILPKDLDAVLCFSDNQIFLPHIYKYCQKNNIAFVPYVGTAHGLWGDVRSRVSDFLFQHGTLKIYKSGPVLAKTKEATNELMALGVGQENIKLAHVGLDIGAMNKNFKEADKNTLKEKYGFQESNEVILFVARLRPEKRPLDMVKIFRKVREKKPDAKLLIIGDGPLWGDMKAEIQRLGLQGSVRRIKALPYEQMWEAYRLADWSVNLNKSEIFGMSIMEAIYYGTPVAAIDAPGPREILDGMGGHRICRDDGEVVGWLLGMRPDGKDLKESAKKIGAAFSWDACAEAFLEIAKKS